MNKQLIDLFDGKDLYRGKELGDNIVTTSLFWDCECQFNFIHPVTHSMCGICGGIRGLQPDSRINEVVLYIQDLYNRGD